MFIPYMVNLKEIMNYYGNTWIILIFNSLKFLCYSKLNKKWVYKKTW
jgi:hypothetical protein